MGKTKNNKPDEPEPERAGRIVVDERGRNVWQWNEHQLDSTTSLLLKLDNMSLAIELTDRFEKPALELDDRTGRQKHRAPSDQTKPAGEPSAGDDSKRSVKSKKTSGFNPYDNS